MLIRSRRRWEIAERDATPERVYLSSITRRAFLGTTAASVAVIAAGCGGDEAPPAARQPPVPADVLRLYPAALSPRHARLDRRLTAERVAARHNNFYELSEDKERVAEMGAALVLRPWTIEVRGLCVRPGTFDVDALCREIGLEERLYRHRCVEAWSMAVPWTGFALSKLLDKVQPYGGADYVRLVSFHRPSQAPGQRTSRWYPWPYYEALRMDEARNQLAFLATGIYGHPLPVQHGAPIRLVVPWKYGFKSIKSIVRIELVATEPGTFWSDLAPNEYGFAANVDPRVPHPRWSQATERMIGTGERRRTLHYNGYEQEVTHLYARSRSG